MIENISINNYALIDHTHIELEKGFSVITGETGAGKSILLGAIGLTLGQRADSSAIMDKTKKCIVEIEYNIAGYALKEWFDENDLDYSEQVMVRRELTAEGKSRCFINDTPVNNKLLKDFGTYMIDIHSQHQSLLLGHPEYQTDILDAFCGNRELSELYQADFRERQQLKSALKQLKDRAADAEKESDYLQFQFNQLESARLQLGEKEALEEELELLTHAENIKSALSGLSWNLRDTEQSVIQVLKGSRNAISALENAFKEAGEYRERLDSVIIELNDLADEAERRAESVEYNAGRIEKINQRLNTIYDLLFKYKAESVEELVTLREQIREKLKKVEGGSEEIERQEKKLQETEKRMLQLAGKIHEMRVSMEGKLCATMKKLLVGLGIKHAEFQVGITAVDEFTRTGRDEVKFLFSANKNQQPGEIARVASGGEISRVMLALKYVLSGAKQLPVIILDEIDTGLSGEVAHRMSLIMREMAGRMQVISISHLPQIGIAALLSGSRTGYTGSVTLGGVPVEQLQRAQRLRALTLVPHNATIFKGTVEANLRMAKPDATEAELWAALEQVNLADFCRSQDGLQTALHEGGSNLSGGQRQRLAMARALLHDTPIYLFDEATSNVDAESENDIMAAIRSLAGRKTVILISHRLANVVDSDCIYVLDKGRIAERGTHAELLKKQGAYSRLYTAQKQLETLETEDA